jgi:hypothetical protein
MSKIFRTISIQYHIKTTSDWTVFQIVEGGFWSNIVVEYIKGKDKLTQDIVYSDKRIEIHKKAFDDSPVEIKVTCKLNIYEDYLNSAVHYTIEKGNIESTVVRVLFKGKEIDRFLNQPPGSPPKNPKSFLTLVAKHPPTGLFTKALTFFKILGLFAFGYLVILIMSLVYCYGFALDFSEFARSNPYLFIVGGAAVGGTIVGIELKRK